MHIYKNNKVSILFLNAVLIKYMGSYALFVFPFYCFFKTELVEKRVEKNFKFMFDMYLYIVHFKTRKNTTTFDLLKNYVAEL